MKKALLLIIVLVLFLFLSWDFVAAQEFGSIKGVVKDAEGAPLPGVTVTLTGSKIVTMTDITSEGGHFRFLKLPVDNNYTLKIQLPGFKTIMREKLGVSFGKDVILNITMEMAEIMEEITVIGEAPVIDTKRAEVGVNVTQEMLMQLPTARNPWVMMDVIPGMLVDKSDVGGNEAGQQSSYYGHGSDQDDNTWSVDGANITDNSALGAAPAYLNLASYEEVQVNYGNNDVKSQTGGVQINLVSKRGGNRYSGTFYLDVTRNAWQSDNVSQELKDESGYTAAGINRLYLYGANFGGPIIRDKAWFYASWGIQDIDSLTLAGTSDTTWLASGYARLDFQLSPSTRANVFVEYDNKQKFNRPWIGATLQSAETMWDQTGPGYLWKGEVDQIFGNLLLNAKFIYTDQGFALAPVNAHTSDGSGDYMVWEYYPTFYMSGNTLDFYSNRDQINANLNGIYFAENLLGAEHEFKFGVDYVNSTTTSYTSFEGDVWLATFGPDDTLPTGEWNEAWLVRDYVVNYYFERFSAFLQDTITLGRLTLNLGVRYDRELSKIQDVEIPANMLFPEFMPAVSLDEYDPGIAWNAISPRFSLTYDLFGNGKDVIKLAIARYGSQSGNNIADFINPLGWTEIDMLWQDLNADGRVTSDELFGYDWDTGELRDRNDPDFWFSYSGTINPDDPTAIEALNQFDPDYNSPLLDELTLSYEKELLPDLATRLEFFYKKRHRQNWIRSMEIDGTLETEDNYYVAGQDESTGYDYYGRDEYFPYRYMTNHDKAFDRYLAGQLVISKRLSNKWMLNGSFTWSDWRRYYKGEYLGVIDYEMIAEEMEVGLNNEEYFDGGVVAVESSGSGVEDVWPNSRWQFKLSGLYQLPYGFNISSVFTAREGYVRATHVLIEVEGIGQEEIYGNPDGSKGKFGDQRLPNFYMLNLRVEKSFRISDASSVTVAADAFNVLNSSHSLQRENRIAADTFGQHLMLLSPRVFRVGIRFSF